MMCSSYPLQKEKNGVGRERLTVLFIFNLNFGGNAFGWINQIEIFTQILTKGSYS